MAVSPDLDRLKSQLLTSGLQQTNNPLYQVINQLINSIKQLQAFTSSGSSITLDLTAIKNKTYWTELNESAFLSVSRQVFAGTGITLDYSVDGKVIISVNADISELGYWAPLTDGDSIETDLIFADAEAIMIFVPTP